jgi:hypothetical protein
MDQAPHVSPLSLKPCFSCQKVKNLDEFAYNGKYRRADCKLCHAAAVNRIRDARVARGDCKRCGRRLPVKGRLTCRECLDQAKTARTDAGVRGFCNCCTSRAAVSGKSSCQHCLDIRRVQDLDLTVEQLHRMAENQNFRCAICGADTPGGCGDFHIDHDHRTGQIRGLLCNGCNRGLGYFRDVPASLEKAAKYLRSPPGIPIT